MAIRATINVYPASFEVSDAVDLAQVEAFLVIAEELHFGRAAERLYVSQSRVSRLLGSLEREVGGTLVERTSRRVRLTPLGVQLREGLRPGYAQLHAALADARAATREAAGLLRVGFVSTTAGPVLNRLAGAFEKAHPEIQLVLREVALTDPYRPLYDGEIDVLVFWLIAVPPDLTAGPAIDHQDRVLAVASTHPLATRKSLSIEDLAHHDVVWLPPSFPQAFTDVFLPATTPSGLPIPHTYPVGTFSEIWTAVARGRIVHPTVASMSEQVNRPDIALIPITDMPAIPLGPLWCTAHENARIRALAKIAAELS